MVRLDVRHQSGPGAFDGKARLEDQDIDGLQAEVLYPSQRTMGTFMGHPTTSTTSPGSMRTTSGCTTSSWPSIRRGSSGCTRCPRSTSTRRSRSCARRKSLGFRGIILAAYPSGRPKLSLDDDPFWAAAEEEGVRSTSTSA
jgi:hypothetical protein